MSEKKQGKVFVVTSGKGGVGKTTSSAAIAYAFAKRNLKTVVIDFDVGLRNLDLIMGCERRVVYDLINVVREEATINQAIIKDKRIDNLLSSKTLKAQKEGEFKEIHLLLNRYDSARAKAGVMLKAEDVSEILYTPIVGIIPESKDILEASNSGHPITHLDDTIAAKAYFDAVDRILGKDIPMRYTEQKTSFFKKLIGK